VKCPSCDHDNPVGAQYCDICGTELGGRAPTPAPPGPGSAHKKSATVFDRSPVGPPPAPTGARPPPAYDPLPPPRPPFDPADPFGNQVREPPRPAWGPPPDPARSKKTATVFDRPLPTAGGPRIRGALVEFRGPDDPGRLHPLREGRNVIGRNPDSDVVLDDGRVSGQHAMLYVRSNDATVVDVSRNGTVVDGRILTDGAQSALGHGSRLQIGEAQFLLLLAPEEQLPRWETT
jgi:hypothetical protein